MNSIIEGAPNSVNHTVNSIPVHATNSLDQTVNSILKHAPDRSDRRYRRENDGLNGLLRPSNDLDDVGDKYRLMSDLQGLCTDNLNNDFEHQCFDEAIKILQARELTLNDKDLGDHVLDIPGIPRARFLPHQIWGIGFVLKRFMQEDGLKLNGVLIADDMGLGKTYTALGAVFHIKWLVAAAKTDLVIPYYGKKLSSLKFKCPLLHENLDILERPVLVVVPSQLIATWAITIREVLEGTGLELRVIGNKYQPTADEINLLNVDGDRGKCIYLISYSTFRSRYDSALKGCRFGMAIFDESHSVKNAKTMGFASLMALNAPYRIQLTATPMHNTLADWHIQTRWLFCQQKNDDVATHGPVKLASVISDIKEGEKPMDEIYQKIKECVWPWTIRRWGETKNSDGSSLVRIPDLATNEVRLKYKPDESKWLMDWVRKKKENEKDKFQAAIHDWRLVCLSANLEFDTFRDGKYRSTWDPVTFSGGPFFRWLKGTLLPILQKVPKNGPPNKAVIFAPLPGHTYLLNWWFKQYYPKVNCFHYFSLLNRKDRSAMIKNFGRADTTSVLILTPALGGTGLNLVMANHVVIAQKFWNLNEQRQAVGRIHRLGQSRPPTSWTIHCVDGVDDRAQELHEIRGKFEARVMHGLMGSTISYTDLLDARNARIAARGQSN